MLSCQLLPQPGVHVTSLCGDTDPLQQQPQQQQLLIHWWTTTASHKQVLVVRPTQLFKLKPTASSHGQVLIGGNVINIAAPPMSVSPQLPRLTTVWDPTLKYFVLKIKTSQVWVCWSCRKDYSGPNDTMGLVARAERRMVPNLTTGTHLGRESNSHYHQVIVRITLPTKELRSCTCPVLSLLNPHLLAKSWWYLMKSRISSQHSTFSHAFKCHCNSS